MVTELHFEDLQKAWEGINEYFILREGDVLKNGAYYGTQLMAFNTHVVIDKAVIDSEFDFGKTLGYKKKKWTTLVKNYVNLDYLDIIRREVAGRKKKKSNHYTYSFHFSNKYGSGKDCLLNMVFSKRPDDPFPQVLFTVRMSEVTTRLLWDFLLVQRICEYVYGVGYPVSVHFFAPSAYITPERMTSYQKHKNVLKELTKLENPQKMQKRMIERIKQFSEVDPETIRYKSNKRFAMNLQDVSNSPALIAKDLNITKPLKDLKF